MLRFKFQQNHTNLKNVQVQQMSSYHINVETIGKCKNVKEKSMWKKYTPLLSDECKL